MVYGCSGLMRSNSMMNSMVAMMNNCSMVDRGYMMGMPICRGSYQLGRLMVWIGHVVNRVDWVGWGMVNISMMVSHVVRGMRRRVGRLLHVGNKIISGVVFLMNLTDFY